MKSGTNRRGRERGSNRLNGTPMVRLSSALRQTKYSSFLRPVQRLFTGKLRIFSLLLVMGVVVVYMVKRLQFSKGMTLVNQMSNGYDLQDNLVHMKDYLEYAVMIDAGSSGSRVHIYVWPPHSGDARQLLQMRFLKTEEGKDVFKKVTPGLSSCADKPSSASEYIWPLLDFAAKHIPSLKHRETPLFILATAGMRLLPTKSQEAILDDLRKNVPRNFSFLFSPSHVQVITGKEEGIYSWISVNYLSGRFDHSLNSESPVAINLHGNPIVTRQRTIGMLEMGGASVQIAFEITSKYELEEIKQRRGVKSEEELKDVLAEFNLGCLSHDDEHSYLLYVTTYLGLGANTARDKYLRALVESHHKTTSAPPSQPKKMQTIVDPCLSSEGIEQVNVTLANGVKQEVTLRGNGDFDVCRKKLLQLLDPKREAGKNCHSSNASCPLSQLRDTRVSYTNTEFYGFSELWYTLEDVLRMGGQYNSYSFKKAASEYCGTKWNVLEDRFQRKLYPLADRDRLTHECFKSVWVSAVLHDGLKMPTSYNQYKSAFSVNGNQVQWTLGALLYRTRFFPLRAVEKHNGLIGQHHPTIDPTSYYLNHLLFFLCMSAVLASIVIYLKHLHHMVNDTGNNNIVFGAMSQNILEKVQVEAAPLLEACS